MTQSLWSTAGLVIVTSGIIAAFVCVGIVYLHGQTVEDILPYPRMLLGVWLGVGGMCMMIGGVQES